MSRKGLQRAADGESAAVRNGREWTCEGDLKPEESRQ